MTDKLRQYLADPNSYPAVFMYGSDGQGGLWKTRNVPAKYSECWMENLPIEGENPLAYKLIEKYVNDVIFYVDEKKLGLFFFSKPTADNPFGVGSGKTTTAVTILNHYLYERLRLHLRGEKDIIDNPVYFMKSNDLQVAFNAQFRGNQQMQQEASERYYSIKNRAKTVDLLVLDDIATKASSEAFTEELYELIDYRSTEELVTIYTSNEPLSEVAKLLGDRIASRIEGATVAQPFTGKDWRKKTL